MYRMFIHLIVIKLRMGRSNVQALKHVKAHLCVSVCLMELTSHILWIMSSGNTVLCPVPEFRCIAQV